MNRINKFHTLFSLGFAAFLSACGGPGEVDVAQDTSELVGSNCRELCRRYVSCERPLPAGDIVGRFYAPAAAQCVAIAEGYLIDAGAGRAENRCWRGNVAVSSQWAQVQPYSDIYRDVPGQAAALVAQCAADFGIN